jgi:hypothetical protein
MNGKRKGSARVPSIEEAIKEANDKLWKRIQQDIKYAILNHEREKHKESIEVKTCR